MTQRTDEFSQAKGKMADDLEMKVRDDEDLTQVAANASGARFTAARAKSSGKVTSARAMLADVSVLVMLVNGNT
jgi:hypothetical protein